MKEKYTVLNSKAVDSWVAEDWEWGRPISHQEYENAKKGEWSVLLTPSRPVPKTWFPDLKGKALLGLASGGGQQMPIFSALGAQCTVFDYSEKQLENEVMVSQREGYQIRIIHGDMTEPLPFEDDEFDLIFNPVSNCFVQDLLPIWKECFRVLKPGGSLLMGFDNGLDFAFNEDQTALENRLPFDPLKDPKLMKMLQETNSGVQFSHTLEEEIGDQLKAGFILKDIYSDIDSAGLFHDYNLPTFYCTWTMKPL